MPYFGNVTIIVPSLAHLQGTNLPVAFGAILASSTSIVLIKYFMQPFKEDADSWKNAHAQNEMPQS